MSHDLLDLGALDMDNVNDTIWWRYTRAEKLTW